MCLTAKAFRMPGIQWAKARSAVLQHILAHSQGPIMYYRSSLVYYVLTGTIVREQQMRYRKVVYGVACFVFLASLLAACGSAPPGSSATASVSSATLAPVVEPAPTAPPAATAS